MLVYPRTNKRVKRFNGIIKDIIQKLRLKHPDMPRNALLTKALYVYNRRPGIYRYSPYFLLYGCFKRKESVIEVHYVRESIEEEEAAFARKLAKEHAIINPRQYVSLFKAL